MRIRWSDAAVEDLQEMVTYISQERPEAARRLVRQIHDALEQACSHPHIGRVVPELDLPDLRERLVQPYRVIYRISGDFLVVVAVHHGRRDLVRHLRGGG